jgi:shikimate dehydrogenase
MSAAPAPKRRGAAVLGSPIAHSLSPVLHRAAYGQLGLEDWSYRAIECTEATLKATLAALEAEGLAGASLTMPLKRTVMELLASYDAAAAEVGAANTVLFTDTPGRWIGANTDVPGLVAALTPVIQSFEAGQIAYVLGAGATAAAAVAAIGSFAFQSVAVIARRPEAAAELAALANRVGLDFAAPAWDDLARAAAAPLVISTTPAGATPGLEAAVSGVDAPGVLFDVIYSPWPTSLAAAWERAGGRVIGGVELLIEQAALQVELMTGGRPSTAVMREAGYAALGRIS